MKKINFCVLFMITCVLSSTMVMSQSRETRNLSNFTSVSVGEAINVVLVPGNENKAELRVSGIDLDEVLTEVNSSRLKIHLESGRHNNIDVDITLTYKSIERLKVSSAADVSTKGPIKASNLEISVSSAGDADLELAVGVLEVAVSSSGDANFSGWVTSQNVEVSSAGSYDGSDLKCDEADVSASSAGSARISASKRVDASASSGGSVKYSGDPDKVRESSSSGGSIRSY